MRAQHIEPSFNMNPLHVLTSHIKKGKSTDWWKYYFGNGSTNREFMGFRGGNGRVIRGRILILRKIIDNTKIGPKSLPPLNIILVKRQENRPDEQAFHTKTAYIVTHVLLQC
jgi:hypothetical protein